MIDIAMLKKISEMDADDNQPLPFGWRMIRVAHPEPVVYTFQLTGLLCFVWIKDYARRFGGHKAHNQKHVQHAIALDLDTGQTEPFRVTHENYLRINAETLGRIAIMHAASRPDLTFQSADMNLFFEKYTCALNDAGHWVENMAREWRKQHG